VGLGRGRGKASEAMLLCGQQIISNRSAQLRSSVSISDFLNGEQVDWCTPKEKLKSHFGKVIHSSAKRKPTRSIPEPSTYAFFGLVVFAPIARTSRQFTFLDP